MIAIKVEPIYGKVKDVCGELIALADKLSFPVTAEVNGVRLTAKPLDSPEELRSQYEVGQSLLSRGAGQTG